MGIIETEPVNKNDHRKSKTTAQSSLKQSDESKIKRKASTAIEKKYKNIAPAVKQKRINRLSSRENHQEKKCEETSDISIKHEVDEQSKQTLSHPVEEMNFNERENTKSPSNLQYILLNGKGIQQATMYATAPCPQIKVESKPKDDSNTDVRTASPNVLEPQESKSKDVSAETINKLRSFIKNKSGPSPVDKSSSHSVMVPSPVLRVSGTPPLTMQEVEPVSRVQSPITAPQMVKFKMESAMPQLINQSNPTQKCSSMTSPRSVDIHKRSQEVLSPSSNPMSTPPKKRCLEDWRANNQFNFSPQNAVVPGSSSANPILTSSVTVDTVMSASMQRGSGQQTFQPSSNYPIYPPLSDGVSCSHCNRIQMDGVAEDKGFLFAAQINLGNGAILLIPCKHVIIQGCSYLKPQQDLFHSVYQLHINPPVPPQKVSTDCCSESGNGSSTGNQNVDEDDMNLTEHSPRWNNPNHSIDDTECGLNVEKGQNIESESELVQEPINLCLRSNQAECDSTDRDTPPLVIDDDTSATTQTSGQTQSNMTAMPTAGVCVVCHFPFASHQTRQLHYQSKQHLLSLMKTGLLSAEMHKLIQQRAIPLHEIIDPSTGNIIPRTLIRYQPFLNS